MNNVIWFCLCLSGSQGIYLSGNSLRFRGSGFSHHRGVGTVQVNLSKTQFNIINLRDYAVVYSQPTVRGRLELTISSFEGGLLGR